MTGNSEVILLAWLVAKSVTWLPVLDFGGNPVYRDLGTELAYTLDNLDEQLAQLGLLDLQAWPVHFTAMRMTFRSRFGQPQNQNECDEVDSSIGRKRPVLGPDCVLGNFRLLLDLLSQVEQAALLNGTVISHACSSIGTGEYFWPV